MDQVEVSEAYYPREKWSKREIKNGDITIALKYSKSMGIYIEITSKLDEVLLLDTIM